MKKLVLDVFIPCDSTEEAKDVLSLPDFAVVLVSPYLVAMVERMRALLDREGLTECRASWSPLWEDMSLDVEQTELVVTPNTFYFTNTWSATLGLFQTAPLTMQEFQDFLSFEDDVMFVGSSPDVVKAAFERAGN